MRLALIAILAAPTSLLASPLGAAGSTAPGADTAQDLSPTPRVYISCANRGATRYRRVYRPERCTHFGRGDANAGGVNLAGLRWSSWNGDVARGRGIERGFHRPYSRIRVRVRAYRVRTACGRRVYTRLRATSRHGTTVVRMAACPRPIY
jgi:hypothetical protein